MKTTSKNCNVSQKLKWLAFKFKKKSKQGSSVEIVVQVRDLFNETNFGKFSTPFVTRFSAIHFSIFKWIKRVPYCMSVYEHVLIMYARCKLNVWAQENYCFHLYDTKEIHTNTYTCMRWRTAFWITDMILRSLHWFVLISISLCVLIASHIHQRWIFQTLFIRWAFSRIYIHIIEVATQYVHVCCYSIRSYVCTLMSQSKRTLSAN